MRSGWRKIFRRVWRSGVLGIFPHLDTTLSAVRRLQELSFADVRVISPVPRHEIMAVGAPTPSPVRFYALGGALGGMLAGFLLAILTSLQMEEMAFRVGGKPVVAWPAFFVIAFELTVLFGTVGTVAGFLLHAWLPRRTIRKSYDPGFSEDRFGVFVPCESDRWEEVKSVLQQAGAEEVRVEEV